MCYHTTIININICITTPSSSTSVSPHHHRQHHHHQHLCHHTILINILMYHHINIIVKIYYIPLCQVTLSVLMASQARGEENLVEHFQHHINVEAGNSTSLSLVDEVEDGKIHISQVISSSNIHILHQYYVVNL